MRAIPVLALAFLVAGPASAATAMPCASGIYLTGRLAAAQSDFARASDMFATCLNRDGKNLQLMNYSFVYGVAAGRLETAVPLAKRLVRIEPRGVAPHLVLAADAMKDRDYAKVRSEIALLSKGKNSPLAFALIDMWAAAGKGDSDAVEADLKLIKAARGLALLGDFATALVNEYRGNDDVAEAAYRKLMQDYGKAPRLVDAFGRFLERRGKADEAKALYQEVVRDSTYRPVALAGLARIAKGEKPDPLIANPAEGAAEALFGMATSMDDDHNSDTQVFYLRLALYLRPHFDLADMLLAGRFAAKGSYVTAIELFDDVPRTSPFHYLAMIQRADAKKALGDEAGALRDVRALAEAYPEDIDVFMSLGDTLRHTGDSRGAIDAYGKAIALAQPASKDDWKLYFIRAAAEQDTGDWKAAEADLKTALDLDPEQSLVLNYLGYTWVDRGEHLDEALKMLEKAVHLDPGNGAVTDSVGWAYYRLGKIEKAVVMLERAVMLEPQDPTINDHLGDAYWKVGRTLEARYQWQHALAFGASDETKKTIDKKLEAGLADGK